MERRTLGRKGKVMRREIEVKGVEFL